MSDNVKLVIGSLKVQNCNLLCAGIKTAIHAAACKCKT